MSARDEMTARAKPILLMLLATAAFLLLAAVANVANLSLSRQMRRARELALRVALGAGHGAALSPARARELVAHAGRRQRSACCSRRAAIGLLRSVATRLTPRAGEIQMNATVFAFALGLCVLIALAVAAAPFVHVLGQRNVAVALRQGNTGTMGDARRSPHARSCSSSRRWRSRS